MIVIDCDNLHAQIGTDRCIHWHGAPVIDLAILGIHSFLNFLKIAGDDWKIGSFASGTEQMCENYSDSNLFSLVDVNDSGVGLSSNSLNLLSSQ